MNFTPISASIERELVTVILGPRRVGHRLENWFLNEIHVWLARNPERSQVHYWRTSTGVEVDFVVVKKPHVYPFEVTMGLKPEPKKIRNLKSFL